LTGQSFRHVEHNSIEVNGLWRVQRLVRSSRLLTGSPSFSAG
jgi:hypothetical protein